MPKILTLGRLASWWIETLLVHGPGDVQGDPIVLPDEFRRFVYNAYALRPDGRRRYRRAFLSRAKGWDKSGKAAFLADFEFLGPCRFAGWATGGETLDIGDHCYRYLPGEPMGRPVTGVEVLCFATEERQAGLVYGSARWILDNAPDLADIYGVDTGQKVTYRPDGGTMELVTSGASGKDGGRSSFLVKDETHLWFTPQLRELNQMIDQNLLKRKLADSWGLEISTAYRQGQGSVAEDSLEYALAVERGEIADPSLLVDYRAGDGERWDLDDDDQLRAYLHDAYGDAVDFVNIDAIVGEFRNPKRKRNRLRRFFGNEVVRDESQWADGAAWDAKATRRRVDLAADWITLGFDGSDSGDSTVLSATRVSDGFSWVVAAWERPEGLAVDVRWEVPRGEVRATVLAWLAKRNVWRLYADPPYWREEIDAWAAEYPDKVVRWATFRDEKMAAALERLHTAIHTEAGEFAHDGSPLLRRHVLNAYRVEKPAADNPEKVRVLIRKEHPMSDRKIDGCVALTLSYEARGDAIAAGVLKTKRRRVASW